MDLLSKERASIDAEARLLFALVDAAAESRLKDPAFAACWGTIRKSAEAERYEAAAVNCLQLLSDLERRGELSPPWIAERLKSIRHRIRSESGRPHRARIGNAS